MLWTIRKIAEKGAAKNTPDVKQGWDKSYYKTIKFDLCHNKGMFLNIVKLKLLGKIFQLRVRLNRRGWGGVNYFVMWLR